MIGDIQIVVIDIRGDKVRLGVEAPKDVPVHRREVYDAIKRSQAELAEAIKVKCEEIDQIMPPTEYQQHSHAVSMTGLDAEGATVKNDWATGDVNLEQAAGRLYRSKVELEPNDGVDPKD